MTDGAVTYEYDNVTTGGAGAKGRLTKVTDPSGFTTFSYDLLGRVEQMSLERFEEYRMRWKCLQTENADLRVMTPRGLVSVPITHFDPLIASQVTDDWQRTDRVLGNALFKSAEGHFNQADDLFLWSRLRTLVQDGVLDGRGDLFSLRDSWVRLNGSRRGARAPS